MPRADASAELLDAAERLFAENGIAAVSDRKIAEAAGNSNHSAVRYYFGGRDGLLDALLDRHLTGLEPARKALFEQSDSLLGDVRALVLPVTSAFAALPTPSYRARFLQQAYAYPAAVALLMAKRDRAPIAASVIASVARRLEHLDPTIVNARMRLMTHILTTACADIEARGTDEPQWSQTGDFLCDAIAGLLQAPITSSP
ncbi:TetR/AcrR family transcriptional regulator [Aeromicrobium wangtongii]|uniref:TetR/AcrR family transcriptional regulator n=1 Tax=Aeromicrobium wangtongii TaxID=2969247 RepID=UPI002018397F|nr:TetR/AcrR family transcriptional regulator [Aeromicrobium wangtongii]MCL3816946.1 TetR/AcrR family transcriptional regulator [Aeromicrobium wangtongii]